MLSIKSFLPKGEREALKFDLQRVIILICKQVKVTASAAVCVVFNASVQKGGDGRQSGALKG